MLAPTLPKPEGAIAPTAPILTGNWDGNSNEHTTGGGHFFLNHFHISNGQDIRSFTYCEKANTAKNMAFQNHFSNLRKKYYSEHKLSNQFYNSFGG